MISQVLPHIQVLLTGLHFRGLFFVSTFTFYVALVAGSYLSGNPDFIRAYFTFGILLLPFSLAVLGFRVTKQELASLSLTFFLVSLYFLQALATGDELWLAGFKPLLGLSVALLFYRATDCSPRETLHLLYVLSFGLFFYIGYNYYFLGLAPNDIFARGSRNHISTLLLTVFVLWALSFTKYHIGRVAPTVIQLALAYLVVSVNIVLLLSVTGRTGLAVSIFILLWALAHPVFLNSMRRQPLASLTTISVIAIALVVTGYYFAADAAKYLAYQRLLEAGVASAARLEIVTFFLDNATSPTGLLGLPYYSIHEATGFSWHSSLIEFWVHYGIFGMLAFFVFCVYCISISAHTSLTLTILMIAILFRSVFDGPLFGPALSVAFFASVLIVTDSKIRNPHRTKNLRPARQ